MIMKWGYQSIMQGRSLTVVEVQLEAAVTGGSGGVEKEKIKAAAGGRPEGLLGGGVEAVALQPATGRCNRCKREGARTSRHQPVRPRGVRGRGPQRRAPCVRLCTGCACAGLMQGASREMRPAKVRAESVGCVVERHI